MTIGDGIFYSTLLLVVAGFFYFITTTRRWKTLGKVFGVLALAGVVVGGVVWAYVSYEDRLRPVTEYMGVELGASRADVILALGSPREESGIQRFDDTSELIQFLYYDTLVLAFIGDDSGEAPNVVTSVCTRGSSSTRPYYTEEDSFNITGGSSEDDVYRQLGSSSDESIGNGGTAKIINYKALNISLHITEGVVETICMTDRKISF